MKIKSLILFCVVFVPFLAFAQGSSLSIFSEDGSKFTLYLDGAQQNNNSQIKLRVDGLTQQSYKARIVFDERAKAPIEKNVTVTDAATKKPADVVYKINSKDGETKLRLFSTMPVQSNYTPDPDVYIVHYGQPDQVTPVVQNVVNTPGSNSGNGSVTFSFGTNVDANDPSQSNGATQITSASDNPARSNDNKPPVLNNCKDPMSAASFKSAKETVKNANFEDTKFSTAKSILASNCFSADQVMQVCQLFGFEQTKLSFAKFAYNKTTDPANYSKVANVFSFGASKTDLNNFIANGGR